MVKFAALQKYDLIYETIAPSLFPLFSVQW